MDALALVQAVLELIGLVGALADPSAGPRGVPLPSWIPAIFSLGLGSLCGWILWAVFRGIAR